jgi:glycine/D-amino acid oxidase-like deaminating enzyme
VPVLAAAHVQGIHVGHRPYPADGYPVLGWLPGCSNAYVAGGPRQLHLL